MTLATWAIMVTMNLEFWDPETVAVPRFQREHLRNTQSPPPNWYVGIRRYDGDCTFYHRAFGTPVGLQPTEAVPETHKAQTTVFTLGKTLFHTFSAGSDWLFDQFINGAPADYGDRLGLRSIWPEARPSLAASLSPISADGALSIIDHFGGLRFSPSP